MFYQFYVIFCIFSRMPRRFTLSDYLHPDKALCPPEQPPKLALYVYPDHQKRYVPQMLHPFEWSLSFETVVASTQCNMDNISSSVRPLKKGLFLKMDKNFLKLFLLLEIKHTSCIYYTMILTEIKILCYRRWVKMIRKFLAVVVWR